MTSFGKGDPEMSCGRSEKALCRLAVEKHGLRQPLLQASREGDTNVGIGVYFHPRTQDVRLDL